MNFAARIRKLFNLSAESANILSENMEELFYTKGDIIIREGQRDSHIYFVESGLVHAYVLQDGLHRSFLFAFDGDMAVPISDSSIRKLSDITLEALDDTLLFKISRVRMEELFSNSLELANWGRKLAEKRLSGHEEFCINSYWTDKSAQYQYIITKYPHLLQKVTLKELASYLNITPQSLSRIRAQRD